LAVTAWQLALEPFAQVPNAKCQLLTAARRDSSPQSPDAKAFTPYQFHDFRNFQLLIPGV